MSATTTAIADGVATVTLDVPDKSMNVLSEEVLEELVGAIESGAARPDVQAVVVNSGKQSGFCAGADVTRIADVHDRDEGTRLAALGQAAYLRVEDLPKPVVAAVHGPCLGGGLEFALACDGIIAAYEPKTVLGLPEVQIGIVPGFGGTQRLPRKVGIVAALDLILTGRSLKAKRAQRMGLVDDIVCPFKLVDEARRYALELAAGGSPRGEKNRKRNRPWLGKLGVTRSVILGKARASVMEKTRGVYPAPLKAIELIGLSFDSDRERAYRREAEAVGELLAGPVSHHLVDLFLAMEDLKKGGGDAVGLSKGDLVAVVGAGVMGADIARLLLKKGARVRLVDVDPEGLRRGMERTARELDKEVQRRRMSRHEADRLLDRLEPSLRVDGVGRAAFAIEAVVERLDVKERVFRSLAEQMPDGAPIYTNTSSIPVATIGAAVAERGPTLGLHFFNPVARMPLLEVVRPDGAPREAVERAVAISRDLGKVPVVVKDSPGFLVNRVLAPYLAEALLLLEEGVDAETIEDMMRDRGFPMGPLTVVDTVGLDVANHVAESLSGFLDGRMAKPAIGRVLHAEGKLGDKAGGGVFVGRGAKREVAPYLPGLLRRARGEERVREPSRGDAGDRLYLLLLAESARAFADGIVEDPRHLDAAMILGAGFPAHTGGPLEEIDRLGAAAVVERLRELEQRFGGRFSPGEDLLDRARAGSVFHP